MEVSFLDMRVSSKWYGSQVLDIMLQKLGFFQKEFAIFPNCIDSNSEKW